MADTVKEAGRGLDALVAERVMGRAVAPAVLAEVHGPGVWLTVPGAQTTVPGHGSLPAVEPCPRYSTDIAAAWQVVEAMDARGYLPQLDRLHAGDERFWRCELAAGGDGPAGSHPRAYVWEDADTAPLAICRAALALLEHQGSG